MATSKGFTDELKSLSDDSLLGVPANELLSASVVKIGKHVNVPLRLFATYPVADAVLNIGSNQIVTGDGATKTTSPVDGTLQIFSASSINFQTGSLTGGTIQRNGATFTRPTATGSGKFIRLVFTYKSALNAVDSNASAEFASYAALLAAATIGGAADPGFLQSAIDGSYVGHIDLESTSTTAYKTAGSGSNIIETAVSSVSRIFRSGGSGSGGGGAITDLAVQTITANVATVKKGFLKDALGRLIGLESDLSLNLLSGVNTLGVVSPAASTAYWLYIDTAFLPLAATVATDALYAGLSYYALTSGAAGPFVISATVPEQKDLSRYYPLTFLKTDGSSAYTLKKDYPVKHAGVPSVNVSPLVYEDPDHSIGTVGSAGQLATYGGLVAGDFPGAASLSSFYSLNTDGTDGSANGRSISTVAGTPKFNSVGFFGRENVSTWDNVSSIARTSDTFFDVNLATEAISIGAWGYRNNWADSTGSQVWFELGVPGDAVGLVFYSATFSSVNYASVNTITASTARLSSGWHHVVQTINAGTAKLYFDGQLVATATGVSGNVTGGRIYIGAEATSAGWVGSLQDAFVTKQALTDSQVNLLYSKRFKGQQLAGGHVLAANSFPLSSLSGKAAFFSLRADANDGSVNAKNLTNIDSVGFTGLGLFGATSDAAKFTAADKSFTSTDAFFNPGNGHSFAVGGWFAADSWTTTTQFLFANRASNSDHGYGVSVNSSNVLGFGSNTAGSDDVTLTTPHTFQDGSWHHFMLYFDYPASKLYCYVDGIQTASATLANVRSVTASQFRINARDTSPVEGQIGRAREVFFIKDVQLTDADIQKLVAASLTLTASVRAQDQDWKANVLSEDGQTLTELSDSWLVDKDDTQIWLGFGGSSASRVNLRLYDGGLGAATVPVRKYDKQFTATPATTLAHGLPSTPTHISILHNALADGQYAQVAGDFVVKADATNIYVDLSSLTISPTADLRIIASVGVPAIGVAKVDKTVTTTYTATVGEKIMTDSSGAAFTITLPASPSFGDEIEFFDATDSWVPNNVTLNRNGLNINGSAANFLLNVDGGKARLKYFNAAQGWRVYT